MRWVLALAIAVLCFGLIYAAVGVHYQLRTLATASTDSMQWTLSQGEVEAKSLETEILRQMKAGTPDLTRIRLRYDILFSRFATLRDSTSFAELRREPDTRLAIDGLTAFFDATLPLIDGDDAALAARLPWLVERSVEAEDRFRQIALTGNASFSRNNEERRKSLSSTLVNIAVLTSVILVMLFVLVRLLGGAVRRAEDNAKRLKQLGDRMKTVVSTALDAIIVTDAKGRIIEFNEVAEQSFGLRKDAALDQSFYALVPDLDEGGVEGRIVRCEAIRPDGTVFPIELALAKATAPEGEITVAFLRDISDRLQAENALTDARDKAIAGEKSKADLLAVMSHEMRTPLNGILGTLDLVEPEGLDTQTRQYLRIIGQSGETLLTHVNDVLEVSRLDAGKLAMKRTSFDLVALLEEIVDGQTGPARQNGNTLSLAPPSPDLHAVYGDPDRLRQILLNLVGNAIKFTRDGAITLETAILAGLSEVELRVTDTGPGIAETDLDRIFADFVTLDPSYQRSADGTGLGLGISRRLAQAMGGTLGAESVLGDGSVFWLRLSLAPPHAGASADVAMADPPALPDLPPLDVLVVEDNPTNRIVACKMLEKLGHRASEARDGQDGVAAARAGRFDAILMDISMPGMDGVVAAQEIQTSGLAEAGTPIIATTAHAMPDDIARFRAAGMENVLIKPLSLASLQGALAQATGAAQGISMGPAAKDAETPLLNTAHLQELSATLSAEALLKSQEALVAEMTSLLGTRITDAPSLADAVHRAAGSAGLFGAERLAGLLAKAETGLRDGSSTGTLPQDQIDACWQDTRAALSARIDAISAS